MLKVGGNSFRNPFVIRLYTKKTRDDSVLYSREYTVSVKR